MSVMIYCAGTATTTVQGQTPSRPQLRLWWTRSRRTPPRPRRPPARAAAAAAGPAPCRHRTTQRPRAAITWRTARHRRRPARRPRLPRPRPRTSATWKCRRWPRPRPTGPTTWWPACPVPRQPSPQVSIDYPVRQERFPLEFLYGSKVLKFSGNFHT